MVSAIQARNVWTKHGIHQRLPLPHGENYFSKLNESSLKPPGVPGGCEGQPPPPGKTNVDNVRVCVSEPLLITNCCNKPLSYLQLVECVDNVRVCVSEPLLITNCCNKPLSYLQLVE